MQFVGCSRPIYCIITSSHYEYPIFCVISLVLEGDESDPSKTAGAEENLRLEVVRGETFVHLLTDEPFQVKKTSERGRGQEKSGGLEHAEPLIGDGRDGRSSLRMLPAR